MTTDNLSQDQFFHGTTHAIKDGMVRPANDTRHEVSEYSLGDPGDMSEGDHAFAARNDENYAWHAAHTFHNNGRRPRVYEVSPPADIKPGPWNKEHPDFLEHHDLADPDYPPHPDDVEEARKNHQDEWASQTGFPVRKRIDIMPERQGTFPTINWNRFKVGGSRFGAYDGANHPTDAQVKFGMDVPMQPTGQPLRHGKSERSVQQSALKMNADIDQERAPKPKPRTGASLRAFMEGKPEPEPVDPQRKLF